MRRRSLVPRPRRSSRSPRRLPVGRLRIEPLEQRRLLTATPHNVILMIGDGMGPEQVEAGRYLNVAPLSFESFADQAEMSTYSASSSITDSAAAGTAMATGQKVNNGVISLAFPGDGSALTTALEIHRDAGKATGLVTTTYMTHATPAAYGAHESSRNNLSQIADDYLTQTRPNVLLGGGGNGMSTTDAEGAGYTVATDRISMQTAEADLDGTVSDASSQAFLSGQFGTSHLPYEYDGVGNLPHLSEMTSTALNLLENDADGFFLMVEGGRIDHAGHDNDLERLKPEVVEFSNAVQVAIDWVNANSSWSETVLIVTADHETGGLDFDPSNGDGDWSTTGHTGVNVPVYARGPGASTLTGTLDNTNIFALTTETITTAPFSLAMIPDTQYYTESGSSHFSDQTQWIADNLASEGIAMVSHVGDLVQDGSNTTQWDRADAAMGILDGDLVVAPDGLVPYSAVPGNHDFDTTGNQSSAVNYINYFGPDRYTGRSWYGGTSADQTSHYQVFSGGGRQFLQLALEWAPRSEAISWGQSVIDAHPDLPVILSTHEYLGTSGRTTVGDDVFNSLVKVNPQIFMVVAGHVSGENHQVSFNDAGLEVIEILADYQSRTNGGDGWMQMIEFFLDVDRVSVETHSPTLDQKETDANSQYSLTVDFDSRFDFSSLPETAHFQQGVDGYTGTVDTNLFEDSPGTSYAAATSLNVDDDEPAGSGQVAQALLRFDNIFGNSTGQIPFGSIITSASLTVDVHNPGSGMSVHRMLQTWADPNTWNSFATDGSGGIQAGSEASATAETSVGTGDSNENVPAGLLSLDVAASLQAWSDGAVNDGWAFLPPSGGTNGIDFYASEGATPPTLHVTYLQGNPNSAPVAENDTALTNEDTAVVIDLLANDSDADGDALSVSSATSPTNGTVVVNADSTITYTPNLNFNGSDAFSYTVSDGSATDTAIVSITINPVNDAPVADDQFVTTEEDTALAITLDAGDVDGDALTYTIDTGPTSGTLSGTAPDLTYTPFSGYTGPDTFSYTVDDGSATDTATVSITVNPVNEAPVANDQSVATDEDTAVAITLDASDANGDALTYTIGTGPTFGILSGTAPNLTYTPNPDYDGADSFTFTANDGMTDGNVATVSITVNPVNDAPVATNDTYQTDENTALSIAAPGVLGNDSDVEDDLLTAVLIARPSHGDLTLNADGSFSYTPNAAFNGTDNFTYQANDGLLDSNIASVSITVDPVGPTVLFTDGFESGDLGAGGWVATSNPVSVNGTGAFSGNYGAHVKKSGAFEKPLSTAGYRDISIEFARRTDSLEAGEFLYVEWFDGGVWVELESTQAGNWGTQVIAIGAGADDNPDFKVRFRVNGNGGNDEGMVDDVEIVGTPLGPPNDPPATVNDGYNVDEDTPLSVAAPGLLTNDSDPDGDPLTVVLKTGPSNGALTVNADGSFDFVADADFHGTDTFTYAANDGTTDGNVATVTISVNTVNDAPFAADDTHSVSENATLNVNAPGLLANDVDVDGDSLTSVLVSDVSNGTLVFGADGSFSYTPDTDFTGSDSFAYNAHDGIVSGNTATVTINVNPVNNAPVATGDSYGLDENTTLNVPSPGVLGNDIDVDGDALTASQVSATSNGSLTLNLDGSFSYVPDAGFTGTDSFSYAAGDGTLTSNVVTVTLTVNPVAQVSVTAISPNTVASGGTVNVTITGTGFANGASVGLEGGSGPTPTVSNIDVVDSSTITATIITKDGGPPRNRDWDVRVTNPDGSTAVLVDGFTVSVAGSALHVAAAPRGGVVEDHELTSNVLGHAVNQAIEYWAAAGVSARELAGLAHVDIHVEDLGGTLLGLAAGHSVWIDNDAAAHGWSGRHAVDLASVVTHEFGHLLGFDHMHHDEVMASTLLPSVSLLAPVTFDGPSADVSAMHLDGGRPVDVLFNRLGWSRDGRPGDSDLLQLTKDESFGRRAKVACLHARDSGQVQLVARATNAALGRDDDAARKSDLVPVDEVFSQDLSELRAFVDTL